MAGFFGSISKRRGELRTVLSHAPLGLSEMEMVSHFMETAVGWVSSADSPDTARIAWGVHGRLSLILSWNLH